jgi:hypothetical protein
VTIDRVLHGASQQRPHRLARVGSVVRRGLRLLHERVSDHVEQRIVIMARRPCHPPSVNERGRRVYLLTAVPSSRTLAGMTPPPVRTHVSDPPPKPVALLEAVRAGAVVVDEHLLLHDIDRWLVCDRENLQGLCASCHARKTARQDGGFGR